MKTTLLLTILPLALAAKREQTSCNDSCTKVLQKQQESCPSGSDSSCLCGLSDSDYWEPLADCDCINPDKKFSAAEIKSQICSDKQESSSPEATSSSSPAKSSSSESSAFFTESSSSDETTPITKSAATVVDDSNADTTVAPLSDTKPVPAQSAPPVIFAQPDLGNGTDSSQATVQAFENAGAASRVGLAVGTVLVIALSFL